MTRKFEPVQDIISPYAKSKLNNDLKYLFDNLNTQGKSIQDLVAKGQLTPVQYAELIKAVNGLISKGNITINDVDKNNFQLDQTYLTEELRQQMVGNAPINAIPADESLTTKKYASGSVTLEKTSNSEQDISKQKWKIESISTIDGLIRPSTKQLSSDFFRVAKGARFFRMEDDVNCYVHVYDEEYNFLNSYAGSLHNEIPIDCYYARFSIFYRDNRDISGDHLEIIYKYKFYNYKFNNSIELAKDDSIYQLNQWQNGFVSVGNGGFQDREDRIVSGYIKGEKGVFIETNTPSTHFYAVIYDQEFNFIRAYSYTTSSLTVNDDFYAMRIVIKYTDDRVVTDVEKDILVNGLNYYNYTSLSNWVLPYETENKLGGKTLLNFGDSIAVASTAGVEGYHELIANKYKMNLVNHARDGARITVLPDNTNHLKTQIERAITNGNKADYILFEGLRNDVMNDISTYGDVTPGYNDELDLGTFCGALEYYCRTLRENWLDAKIIFVRTHNTSVVSYTRQKQLGNFVVEICEKYSIPVVDIWKEGGLNTQISDMVGTYTLSEADATHPNTLGYETFYVPLIESKMKSI